MGKIALLADKETATYFRLGGVRNSWPVENPEEAQKMLSRLLADETISLIITTESVYEWVQPVLGRMKKDYPLVVSIAGRSGPKVTRDVLAELIKRTVGVEITVR